MQRLHIHTRWIDEGMVTSLHQRLVAQKLLEMPMSSDACPHRQEMEIHTLKMDAWFFHLAPLLVVASV